MPNEHSEFHAIVRAFTAKPLVVRSLAWAAIFVAIGLLLHPTYVVNSVRYAPDYPDGTIRLVVFAAIALLFGLALAKLTEPIYSRRENPSMISATTFVLTDSKGRPLGFLGQADGDPFLSLGLKGEPGGVLLTKRGLTLFDEEDNPQAALEVTETGPGLVLNNTVAGHSFARLEFSQDGAKLSLGSLAQEMASLEATDDGPVFTLTDVSGKEVANLSALGWASLDLTDRNGCVALSTGAASECPHIEIKNSNGGVIWQAP